VGRVVRLLLLLAVPASAAPTDEEIAAAVRQVYAEADYDTTPPGGPAPGRPPPVRDRPQAEVREPAYDPGPPPERSSDLAGVLRAVAWIGVGIAGLLVVGWLVRERAFRGAGPSGAPATPAPAPAAPGTRLDPAALAAAGRYAEAIRALLIDLLERPGAAVPAAWTSREALGRHRWPAAAQPPRARHVEAVERRRFGGAPADEGAYRACAGFAREAAVALGEPAR
jgi:hypothetical protein